MELKKLKINQMDELEEELQQLRNKLVLLGIELRDLLEVPTRFRKKITASFVSKVKGIVLIINLYMVK